MTQIQKLDEFYSAEDYHKDYFKNNKLNPYCLLVINPKVNKIKKKYFELLKH